MPTCTRRLEFDAAHRVLRHESKCAHLHGHRYVVIITCETLGLDDVGRVIDFSVVKDVVGGWIDNAFDHGTIVNSQDESLINWLVANKQKHYVLDNKNPTAEVLASEILFMASNKLSTLGVGVCLVVVFETPNCSSEARA